MTKKFPAFFLLFMITNLLQSLVKTPICLIFFFFAKQCSVIENNCVFNSSTNPVTNQYLSNIEFKEDDIKRVIFKLDPNTAHGHDMISIW